MSESLGVTALPVAEHAGSAVPTSTYSVPRRLLWSLDMFVLGVSLVLARALTPSVQRILSAETAARVPALSWLSLVPVQWATGWRPLSELLWIPLVMAPTTLLFIYLLGGFEQLMNQSRLRVAASCILAPTVGVSFVTLVLIAVRNQATSRAFLFSFVVLTMAGLLAYRFAIRAYKGRRLQSGHYARNVVVACPDTARQVLTEHFRQSVAPTLYRLCGFLDVSNERPAFARSSSAESAGRAEPALVGAVGDLGDILVHQPIHEVLAVQSTGSEAWLAAVIEQCEYFQVTLRLVPETLLTWQPGELKYIVRGGPLRLPEIVLRPRYLDGDALFVKRVMDLVVSSALLVLLAPLFLVIAVAIKLTTPRLPVFYPWKVVGYLGRAFTGYKFTTMVADADERKQELQHLNEMSGPVFKIKDDPRMTPLGRWLRKFSLNELPQLWSVLKGDMSLVGPRPAYPNELARYELWQKRKLSVQPGMTCLWQVRGRNRISSFDDWVRMDFEYIENWSLWLDCRILARTVWTVLGGSGS